MYIALLIFAILFSQSEPINVSAGSDGKFAFDWSGLYSDGTPMAETSRVEFHYAPVPPISQPGPGDGHQSVELPLAAVIGANTVPMKDALKGVPEGVYDLSIRLFGVGGSPSDYSSALSIRARVKKPSTPTALRVVGG